MRMKSRLRRLMGLERRPATQTPESLLSAVQSLPGVQAGCTRCLNIPDVLRGPDVLEETVVTG